MTGPDRNEDAFDDELTRNINARQSRKIRRSTRRSDSRVLVFERPESALEVYASGVRGDPCWGVWTRRGTYCDDRPMPIGALGTLLARHEPQVVDVERLGGTVSGVFERRCRS